MNAERETACCVVEESVARVVRATLRTGGSLTVRGAVDVGTEATRTRMLALLLAEAIIGHGLGQDHVFLAEVTMFVTRDIPDRNDESREEAEARRAFEDAAYGVVRVAEARQSGKGRT